MPSEDPRLVLTLSCPDRVGVVAAVSGFITSVGGWIAESATHSDRELNRFFMREELLTSTLSVDEHEFRARFVELADEFEMEWKLTSTERQKRIAVLVSKEEHCLYDLLSRHRSNELGADIACVISNHDDLADVVRWHGIEFHHVPIDKDSRSADFAALAGVLASNEVDVVVLARYMQVLPDELCTQYSGRMINIHHGFLPSFKGAKPYHQAHERGVKLIGATCHYVTADLDEGPIIEQDVIRIDHSNAVSDIVRSGKDIEKAVLARGLRWHLEDRVFVSGGRTVVFR